MKTILITGTTSGIGRVTALELAREGHTLMMHKFGKLNFDSFAGWDKYRGQASYSQSKLAMMLLACLEPASMPTGKYFVSEKEAPAHKLLEDVALRERLWDTCNEYVA